MTTNLSTGPNGQFAWLTCGIDPNNNSTGWAPPFATVDQVITYQGGLRAAVQASGSPYQPCTRYVDLFETAGAEFQGKLTRFPALMPTKKKKNLPSSFLVPPLFIAAFALQESGCNPNTEGGGGEQGMMQISPVSGSVWKAVHTHSSSLRTNVQTHPTGTAKTSSTTYERPLSTLPTFSDPSTTIPSRLWETTMGGTVA